MSPYQNAGCPTQEARVLATQSQHSAIMDCVVLTINIDYFPKQHLLTGLCNGETALSVMYTLTP